MPPTTPTSADTQSLAERSKNHKRRRPPVGNTLAIARQGMLMLGLIAGATTTAASLAWLEYAEFRDFFLGNRECNATIVGVFFVSQLYALSMAGRLERASRMSGGSVARLIRSLEAILTQVTGKNIHTVSDPTHALTVIEVRFDQADQWMRYASSALLFLGLLGTFLGLLTTIGGVTRVIEGISGSYGAISEVMKQLNNDLSVPLRGMEIAFSSSLIGLLGSLLCGLSALVLCQTHTRFLINLEACYDQSAGTMAMIPGGARFPAATVETLIAQNADTISRLEKLSDRQIQWLSHQSNEGNPARLASLVEKRIEQVDNVLVRLAASIHEITKSLPEQNLYKGVGDSMDRIESSIQETIQTQHTRQHQRIVENEDFREFLRDELRLLARLMMTSRDDKSGSS